MEGTLVPFAKRADRTAAWSLRIASFLPSAGNGIRSWRTRARWGRGKSATESRSRGHAQLAPAYRSILLQAIHLHCTQLFQKNRRSCEVSGRHAHKSLFCSQTRFLHARPPPLVDVSSREEAESILCCFGLFVNLVNQEPHERPRGRTGYSVRLHGRLWSPRQQPLRVTANCVRQF